MIRPGRDDRRLLTLLKPCTRGPGAKTLLSSLPGRTFFFALFPSTSYWATFIASLRDESSAHASKPYVDADGQLPDWVGVQKSDPVPEGTIDNCLSSRAVCERRLYRTFSTFSRRVATDTVAQNEHN